MDKLTNCKRCSSNACYEQHVSEEVTTWLCMGCGFSTSSYLKDGSDLVKQTINTSPELYKDLAFKDDTDLIWFPATITIPEKGMVFIDGVDSTNWKWAAVKAVLISDKERERYPSDQKYRMDMTTINHFNQGDFMDALEVIGFYQID